MFLVLGPMDGWAVFFVLGTYGGWVATLENPFGTLEALETLGTLCVALCGDKVRTIFHVASAVAWLIGPSMMRQSFRIT